jgi:hypothetical protein
VSGGSVFSRPKREAVDTRAAQRLGPGVSHCDASADELHGVGLRWRLQPQVGPASISAKAVAHHKLANDFVVFSGMQDADEIDGTTKSILLRVDQVGRWGCAEGEIMIRGKDMGAADPRRMASPITIPKSHNGKICRRKARPPVCNAQFLPVFVAWS